MRHDANTLTQPLFLPTAQSGTMPSPCIQHWGDLPPAILGERHSADCHIGEPAVTASELVLQLVNHAVFQHPLPAPCNAHPGAGGLLGAAPPREWHPVIGWADAPPESHSRYIGVYFRASVALQTAMREWIPSLYFDQTSRLDDLDLAQGMIAYRASRPAVGDHVDRLTYDILDPEMMDRCYFWVERNIRPILGSLLPLTEKLESSRRGFFDPRNTKRILLRLKRAQRGFQMILKAEEDIITQLVKLASSTPKLRVKAARRPKVVATESERNVLRTTALIEARLRRVLPHADIETLARMIIIVFTESLEQSWAEFRSKAA